MIHPSQASFRLTPASCIFSHVRPHPVCYRHYKLKAKNGFKGYKCCMSRSLWEKSAAHLPSFSSTQLYKGTDGSAAHHLFITGSSPATGVSEWMCVFRLVFCFQVCLSVAHESRETVQAGRAHRAHKSPLGISTKHPQVKEQAGTNTVSIKCKLKLISVTSRALEELCLVRSDYFAIVVLWAL